MTNRLTVLDWIALILVIIGGINWGVYGLLGFDLIEVIFIGAPVVVASIIYIIVGVAAIYLAIISPKLARK